jgi:pyruvate dehydrogenase E2 component (dihydrolipoamide acetyltransferase)
MPSVSTSQITVPDIGDFADVPIIEILVSVGDTVAAEDPLVTLESDKATMDVPAPFGGVVTEILVTVGDRVSEGTAVITIAPTDGAQPAQPVHANGGAPATSRSASGPATTEPGRRHRAIYASPSARRLARELGVALDGVEGSGRKGRITNDDVRRLSQAPAAGSEGRLDLLPWPAVEFEKYGPVERVARSRIQRISAPKLARNWVMIPHVTQNDEADITELEAWRKQLNDEHAREGVKFTIVTFLVAACVAALKEFPSFNSSLDGDELVLKRYYNIGFAADTPGGLVVPVIKGADQKGLKEIAADLTALSGKARDGKLAPGDMSGATFTISSLGGIGGTSFTPIINAPEVAILGVTRAVTKPVWDGSAFVPRLIVPLSLSYDHRVIDGAAAARFVVYLAGVLSDLRRALL